MVVTGAMFKMSLYPTFTVARERTTLIQLYKAGDEVRRENEREGRAEGHAVFASLASLPSFLTSV